MKKKALKIFAIIETLIIFLLIAGIVYFKVFHEKKDDAVSVFNSKEVRNKAVIEKNETVYQTDGEKILISDSALGEIYLPVIEGVEKCQYNIDNIVTRNNYSFYKENNEITSIFGIDVSQYQGDIDWRKVAESGVKFAFLRAGVRTYGGGEIHIDDNFQKNAQEALANGIDIGVYFFSQAISKEEAIEEADFLIDTIRGYNIKYPVVFDWEIIMDDTARTDGVSVDILADCCTVFCERVKSAGYKPMIYQNLRTSLLKLDLLRLKDYEFWLAQYNEKPTYIYDYQIWQYASDGTVPGIEGDVDLNISFKDYSKE
ncbi:MAG: glycoside hydrolase family 25 protein [Oscillospiraceae bacterium]|nr:glycoside hydrolase family 25 protein [Oscillospiraceae bacterium]